jgi:hypothetical protein
MTETIDRNAQFTDSLNSLPNITRTLGDFFMFIHALDGAKNYLSNSTTTIQIDPVVVKILLYPSFAPVIPS